MAVNPGLYTNPTPAAAPNGPSAIGTTPPQPAPGTIPGGTGPANANSQAASDEGGDIPNPLNMPWIDQLNQQRRAHNAAAAALRAGGIQPGATGTAVQGATRDANGNIIQGAQFASSDDPWQAYANNTPYAAHQVTTALPVVLGGAAIGAANATAVGQHLPPNEAIATGTANDAVSRALQLGQLPATQAAGAGNAAAQSKLLSDPTGQRAINGQNWLTDVLQRAAAGNGPSAAQSLFQSATDKNIASMRAAAAGQRGASAVGAARNAGIAGEDVALQSQAQAAALRAQEQQQAQALLGTNLAAQRQGDVSTLATKGQIAGQARGYDITTQQGVNDLMNNVRSGDATSAGVLANAINQRVSTDATFSSQMAALGIDYGKLVAAAVAGDQQALAQLAQIDSQNKTTNRNISAQKSIAKDQLVGQIVGGALGGLANGAGAGIVKAVSGEVGTAAGAAGAAPTKVG